MLEQWIVIVDMDQPGNRMAVALEADDDFSCCEFASFEVIQELKSKHQLGVFTWWALNYVTGELRELYR